MHRCMLPARPFGFLASLGHLYVFLYLWQVSLLSDTFAGFLDSLEMICA